MHKFSKSAVATLVSGLLLGASAHADVSITQGKTAIPDGEATHAQDITVKNEHVAFALAVESAPPWGVPRGTLVDLAAVKNGKIDLDRVAFADFIPNSWSAWPNDRKSIEIVEDSDEKAVIKVSRNFDKVDITTWYTLAAGSDAIALKTVMNNQGEDDLELESGHTIWPDTGYQFAVPGLEGNEEAMADNALADRMVAYDRDWAFALHAPYFDRIKYNGRDMYLGHTLKAGESRTFESQLQVVPNGDMAPIVKAEAERHGEATGTIEGKLRADNGQVPNDALVMIEKDGHPYAWTLAKDGQYSMELPAGEYQVYGTATGHANSQSQSINVSADGEQTLNFTSLKSPATLALNVEEAVSGVAKDARVTIIEGQAPPVEFLGKRTFFTDLLPAGHAELNLAPGEYKLGINAGAGFTAESQTLDVTLESGKTNKQLVKIPQVTFPNRHQWYGADLHHHGNVLEGVTPPEIVVRAQLATDLDLTFISDHDSTINHKVFADLSAKRGVPFIPSIEISPSWGHMNPFPIDNGAALTVDPGTDDVHTLIDAAHEMGAEVVPMNHPYNDYGYFTNIAKDAVPGGKTDRFDLMELNARVDNEPTLEKAHKLWDQGEAMYLTAGTDTHDAWNQLTGRIRMMANVDGELTPLAFAKALKAGHGYATQGPILYPQNIMFGETAKAGDQWDINVVAADGLKEVRLIGQGGEVLNSITINPEESTQRLELSLPIPADAEGWINLEVEDKDGSTAWTNPVWLQS
ncbi:CehA/McbA family metallohydrolase [Salinivibrio sp. IB643]|uniref:CehA/McbA family metallohydrolase n=1 Tax=Salinivibrio TaxID=51366 RepID=UPI0009890FC2|nr:CehA/McbA family metallohydrolase [Salinivibrio sp. IB643]OOE99625.1 phosphoesterase [Salinivibrio sp. IB643]